MLAAPLIAVLLAAAAAPVPAAERVADSLPAPKAQLEIAAMWLPAGKVMSGASGEISSSDAATAMGVVPAFDARISRRLTLGIALPVLFNVRSGSLIGDAPSTEIEAVVRLTGWFPIARDLDLFLRGGAGYYVIVVPDRISGGHRDPQGLVALTAAGVAWRFSERLFAFGDVGVHFGYRPDGISGNGYPYPQASAYVHAGAGVGTRF
jgi:hypothetical protein